VVGGAPLRDVQLHGLRVALVCECQLGVAGRRWRLGRFGSDSKSTHGRRSSSTSDVMPPEFGVPNEVTVRPPAPPEASRRLAVASVPSGHVYVRHLSPLQGNGPRRLPDPDPDDPRRSAQQRWWPPVMLDPHWAATADYDVFHLHFGFDACSPALLRDLVSAVHDRGRPFVFTIHDLRNPHHEDRTAHDKQLDSLVPAADALITLTEGAALQIEQRWGRAARVVAHPHVVDLTTMAVVLRMRSKGRDRPFRVGLHVKSLRAGMYPMGILPDLVTTIADLDRAVLQVDGHRDVLDRSGARYDAELAAFLHEEAARGHLELSVHDYFSDRELWCYLSSLDVSVLPYRFGTHSGWLEACRDLGTTVVAPSCGYFAEQGPVFSYQHDETSYDGESLRTAISEAYRIRPRWGATIEERRQQRKEVAAAHHEIYCSVL
jgi:hypothetical protein